MSAREMPHYDLVESKRKLAVKNGAIELTIREAAKKYEQFYQQQKEK